MHFVSFNKDQVKLTTSVSLMQIHFLPQKVRSSRVVITGVVAALSLLVATCDLAGPENDLSGVFHIAGQEFAGPGTCIDCHRSISESHALTAHALTSGSEPAMVKGSFDSGRNELILNERLKVVMERKSGSLFQTGYVDGVPVDKKTFDITIGSGRKGQSFLYWQDNILFQLPVSYYSPRDTWSNSPGYPTDQLVFDRSITARCLECHSTFFKIGRNAGGHETFDRGQVMLGVSCERCHGPAGDHVRFHRRFPTEKDAQNIVNPGRLTRKQKLDNCALCHSGLRENFMPSFSFLVGDNLDDFSYPGNPGDSAATLDVHGNQYGLLSASKCFKKSDMDCSSCHDVHQKETNRLELFSSRCMSCHKPEKEMFCSFPAPDLAKNCIDCHMPLLPSRQVFLRTADDVNTTPFMIRTHLVGIYDAKVKEFLERTAH